VKTYREPCHVASDIRLMIRPEAFPPQPEHVEGHRAVLRICAEDLELLQAEVDRLRRELALYCDRVRCAPQIPEHQREEARRILADLGPKLWEASNRLASDAATEEPSP
jgi:hypothetical protein